MKLVEILARELEEWPEGVITYSQDDNGTIGACDSQPSRASDGVGWSMGSGSWVPDAPHNGFKLKIATDHATAIVTRADWEAERANINAASVITASKPKANGDGWLRHRGGKCPVEAGVLVDIKARDGQVWKAQDPVKQCEWRHDGDGLDIMRYRIHKPADQVEPVSDTFSQVNAPEPILTIRDRIYELDSMRAEVESTYQRQISEITQERESLVHRLAGEGLALVEVVGQSVEDMSDWRNWKAGDMITCMTDEYENVYAQGKSYAVKEINNSGALVYDDCAPGSCCSIRDRHADKFKWHSRPTS